MPGGAHSTGESLILISCIKKEIVQASSLKYLYTRSICSSFSIRNQAAIGKHVLSFEAPKCYSYEWIAYGPRNSFVSFYTFHI